MVLLAVWVTATMQIARNPWNECINGLWEVAFHIRVSKMVANMAKMYLISTKIQSLLDMLSCVISHVSWMRQQTTQTVTSICKEILKSIYRVISNQNIHENVYSFFHLPNICINKRISNISLQHCLEFTFE